MRFLKKLLMGVYIYLAVFAATALAVFAFTGKEPNALIGASFGVAGIESLLAAFIKSSEASKKGKGGNK